MVHSLSISADEMSDCWHDFRARGPHVHCITNSVAQNFTANVLLAAGGVPSMTVAVEEQQDFVEMADALLINLGTLDEERKVAINVAVKQARVFGKPWVLDPVFVQASKLRAALALDLLSLHPSVMRCNMAEASALGAKSGVDDDPWIHRQVRNGTVVAVSGHIDRVYSASGSSRLSAGTPLMGQVTAIGCALNAVLAGFCTGSFDRHIAVVTALSYFSLAGQFAAKAARGPGSFVPSFLDNLAAFDPSAFECQELNS